MRRMNMNARRLCVILALLLASAASSEEDCAATLANLETERSALTASLDSEKENVQSLTSILQEKEEAMKKLSSEIESLTSREAKCESELKISQGAEKQMQVELANSFARVQVLSADINQLTKLQEKATQCEKQGSVLEEKTAESQKCESELKISQGAEKQMQVELANSFARVQVLSADINQLTKLSDNLKQEAEEKDRTLTEVTKRALLAEAELQSLKQKAGSKGVGLFMSQVADFSLEQVTRVSPYWRSLTQYVQPLIQSVMTSPMTTQALEVCRNVFLQGKDLVEKLYADAKPFLYRTSKTFEEYGGAAANKANDIYAAVKPLIQQSFDAIKVFLAAVFHTVVETCKAVAESKLVADIKHVSSETVDELQSYIQAQMQQIASLQPFAKPEYVRFIVCSMLAVPPLFVVGLLYTCLGRSAPAAKPTPEAVPSTESAPKKGRRKKSKGKVVNVGGDVVKYGA